MRWKWLYLLFGLAASYLVFSMVVMHSLRKTEANPVDPNLVHIVFSSDDVDDAFLCGLATAINSLYRNCPNRSQVMIHIVVPTGEAKQYEEFLRTNYFTAQRFPELKLEVRELPKQLHDWIVTFQQQWPFGRDRLRSTMNYARFVFPDIFPELRYMLYLDTDIVVAGDITELWNLSISAIAKPEHARNIVGVVQRRRPVKLIANLRHPLLENFTLHGQVITHNDLVVFNAGVMFLHLDEWRKQNVTMEAFEYVRLAVEATKNPVGEPLFFGNMATNPPLVLAAFGKCFWLPPEWNVQDLAARNKPRDLLQRVAQAKLLHWNGDYKPWNAPIKTTVDGVDMVVARERWNQYCMENCCFD